MRWGSLESPVAGRGGDDLAADRARDLKAEVNHLKVEGILAAATTLFSERGYGNCTMDDIAHSIGVTKPFVYYRFKDKADILAAICERGARLTHDSDRRRTRSTRIQYRTPPRLLRELRPRRDGPRRLHHRLQAGGVQPPAGDRRAITELRRDTDELVRALLLQGQEAGEFEPDRRNDRRQLDHRHAELHRRLVPARARGSPATMSCTRRRSSPCAWRALATDADHAATTVPTIASADEGEVRRTASPTSSAATADERHQPAAGRLISPNGWTVQRPLVTLCGERLMTCEGTESWMEAPDARHAGAPSGGVECAVTSPIDPPTGQPSELPPWSPPSQPVAMPPPRRPSWLARSLGVLRRSSVRTKVILGTVAIVVIAGVAVGAYYISGAQQRAYDKGHAAYLEGDCAGAIRHRWGMPPTTARTLTSRVRPRPSARSVRRCS